MHMKPMHAYMHVSALKILYNYFSIFTLLFSPTISPGVEGVSSDSAIYISKQFICMHANHTPQIGVSTIYTLLLPMSK